MAIQLRKKIYKNNKTGFYLDVYNNGKRSYEFLKDCYLITKPKNPFDRENNKLADETAKQVLAKRQLELANDEYGFESKTKRKGSFTKYFQSFVLKYVKKDKRKSASALKAFIEFAENKDLSFTALSDSLVRDFKDYLEAKESLSGETPFIYLNQLKKVIKLAYKDGIIRKPFGEDVRISKTTAIRKDILTEDELRLLVIGYCGNEDVKRAFLFSCNTGLRYVDIKQLTWKQIKRGENGLYLDVIQSKTGKSVKVNLNKSAIKYLGDPLKINELIFCLPSHTSINKNLKNWAKKSGVIKAVTYHVARHTFGTLLAHNNTNLKNISSLMGHTSLNYTNLYVRESEILKQNAVDTLPVL